MVRVFSRLLPVLLLGSALPALGQGVAVQILVQVGSTISTVSNQSSIALPVNNVGASEQATITLLYTGAGRLAFPSAPQLIGADGFSIPANSAFPGNIGFGQSVTFRVQYRATNSRQNSAQLSLAYTETQAAVGGSATVQVNGFLSLGFVGGAPELTLGYALPADQNTLPLPSGGSLVFPATLLQTTATATVLVVNRGSATATIDQLTLTGADFQFSGLPLLPANLGAGQSFQFTIRYQPRAVGESTGGIVLRYGEVTQNFSLRGSGVASLLIYETERAGVVTQLTPGGRITFPDTRPGSNSRQELRIRNGGSTDVTISALTINGLGFSLSDLPTVPQVLTPGTTITTQLNFTPTDSGEFTGRLRIGAESFELFGVANAARLEYNYSNAAGNLTVSAGGTVVFPAVSVGQRSNATFTIRNTGNQEAPLTTIGILESGSVFLLSNLPALPASLGPGESWSFNIAFAPRTTGFASATLRIDAISFNLTGQGNAPPPLPSYRFEGPSGTVDPFQQLQLGLTLSQAYPIAVSGTLTITTVSDLLPADPAVQFSSGGRTVAFTIAANTTQAIFPNGTNRIRMQTGSVASTLAVTPSFGTQAGLDLTPGSPTSLSLNIPSTKPQLLSASITPTGSGFTLNLRGYSTPRALSELVLNLTARSGVTVSNPQQRLNLEVVAGTWFRSTASNNFGGQFVIDIPFTLSGGTGGSVTTLFQSATVTISNGEGASNPITLNFN